MASLSDKIGFDITQKERGRITSNYQGLKELFESENFVCEEFTEFPITLKFIEQYRIVIFACPDSSKLRLEEITTLLHYVKQGGTLILLNHAGGDQGRRTNLGTITTQCGINFNNNQVFDPLSNLGMDSYPLITKVHEHPILQDISDICFRIGCTLDVSDNAIPLAFTTDSADPPHKPILALASYGKGYILVSGSYEMFIDEVRGGITYANNAKLLQNFIQWLSLQGTSHQTSKEDVKRLSQRAPDQHESPLKVEVPEMETRSPKLEALEKQISQVVMDMRKMKEEIKTILDANAELKEKISIFELNIADFPNQLISDNNSKIQDINSKLKAQSNSIAKIKQEVSQVQEDLDEIANKLEIISEPIQFSPPTNEVVPMAPPTITNNNEFMPVATPVITTAANFMDKGNQTLDPRVVAELNAYNQIIQILENQLKGGVISKEIYQKKRFKFDKRIAELEEHS